MDNKNKKNPTVLVFGLCGAVGSCVDEVEENLRSCLLGYGFEVIDISAKDSIKNLYSDVDKKGEVKNWGKREYQDAGDLLRVDSGTDAIAKEIVKKIKDKWPLKAVGRNENVAFIIKSLKHEDEVKYLRKEFGNNFIQISVHREEEKRREKVRGEVKNGIDEGRVSLDCMVAEIMAVDKDRSSVKAKFGSFKFDEKLTELKKTKAEGKAAFQNIDKAFRLGDLFVRGCMSGEPGRGEMENQIERFLRLCSGDMFITPTNEEYSMHAAYIASLRSTDLGRQVGAVIVDEMGYIIATGWNEVPKAGGGVYEDGDEPDARDFNKGHHPKYPIILKYINDYENTKGKSEERRMQFWKDKFNDLTRSMHAEMAGIIGAARRGVAVNGATIYTTTFPCHNCLKHIIASGIKKVIYIDAYDESLAHEFHGEEISTNGRDGVQVIPYMGVAPLKIGFFFERKDEFGSGGIVKLHKNGKVKREPIGFIAKLGLTTEWNE